MKDTSKSSHQRLDEAFGKKGAEEYNRLVWLIQNTANRFGLILIESDFSPEIRELFIKRLREELLDKQISLPVIRLSQQKWNLVAQIREVAMPEEVQALLVVGIDNTPGFVPQASSSLKRPSVIAELNLSREAIRRSINGPLIFWCEPLAYTSLQESAPDFYDYSLATFSFFYRSTEHKKLTQTRDQVLSTVSRTFFGAKEPSKVNLHEMKRRVEKLLHGSSERADALLNYAYAVAENQWTQKYRPDFATAAIDGIHEAINIYQALGNEEEFARANVILALMLIEEGRHTGNLFSMYENISSHLAIGEKIFLSKNMPNQYSGILQIRGDFYTSVGRHHAGESEKFLRTGMVYMEQAIEFLNNMIAELSNEGKEDQAEELSVLRATLQVRVMNTLIELPKMTKQEWKRAIELGKVALQKLTDDEFDDTRGLIHFQLGVKYSNINYGEEIRNHKLAIEHLKSAFDIYTRDHDWERQAIILNAISVIHRDLKTGNAIKNLREALLNATRAEALLYYTSNWGLRGNVYLEKARTHITFCSHQKSKESLHEAWRYFVLAADAFAKAGNPKASEHAEKMKKGLEQWVDPKWLQPSSTHSESISPKRTNRKFKPSVNKVKR